MSDTDSGSGPSIPVPANASKGLVKHLRVLLRYFEEGEFHLENMETYLADPTATTPFCVRQSFSIREGLHGYFIAEVYGPLLVRAWHVLGETAVAFNLNDYRGYGKEIFDKREDLKRCLIDQVVLEVLHRGL